MRRLESMGTAKCWAHPATAANTKISVDLFHIMQLASLMLTRVRQRLVRKRAWRRDRKIDVRLHTPHCGGALESGNRYLQGTSREAEGPSFTVSSASRRNISGVPRQSFGLSLQR
jgi:hypothetical protein